MTENMSKILNKWNQFIAVTLVVTLLMSMSMVTSFAGEYIDNLYLKYNGEIYKYKNRLITLEIDDVTIQTGDMPAVLVNNTTMVPVREVFESEAIGATVNWNGATNEVYITYLDQFIVLKIDSKTAEVNGKKIKLDVPAMLIQDMSKDFPKTMLPLRFVSENLGFDVGWNKDTFTAAIDTGKALIKEEEKPVTVPTEDDTTVVSDEQLDKLTGTKANRPLPTVLLNSPITFSAIGGVNTEIEESYSEAIIVPQDHPFVFVDDIDYVVNGDNNGFEIKATGKITNVSTHVWDGKFVIDIYNSSLKVDKEVIDYADNDIVSSVRMGDHEDADGNPYSTIVFDLRSTGYKFNLKLSDDRKTLYAEAVSNSIYKVELKQNNIGDYIDITGVNATNIKTFRMSNPSRIVFDMPNTKTLLGTQSVEAEGQYVTAIRTAQFEATTSRIVIETDGQPDYQVLEVNDTTTRIQIFEPTYENITYDNTDDTPTIVIDKKDSDTTLTIDNVTYKDNYLNKESIITLKGDYTEYFASETININDEVIDEISFKLNSSGDTEIVIKSNSIRVFRIEEVASGLQIKAYKPTELYSKVIVIDAGHGGKDPGAVVGSYYESNLNLGVTLELKKLLDNDPSIKVYYTRIDNSYPTLQDRTILANEVDADVFISLHCNSFISTYRGTETLYLPGSTANFSSLKVAEIFQKVFTDNTALEDYKIKERDNLYVLKHTDMPAIILEMGYLTNEYDRSYLVNPDYHDDLAKGIQASINAMFVKYPTGR